MGVAPPLPPDSDTIDHFVYLREVPWDEYQRLLALRGESSVPRMTYLHGLLEMMAPSKCHERDKTRLARSIAARCCRRATLRCSCARWRSRRSARRSGHCAPACADAT